MNYLKIIPFFLFLCTTSLNAQFRITGKLTDADNQALSFANVLLLSSVDSALVKGEFTGEDGTFIINIAEAKDYLVSISMIGFDTWYATPFAVSSANPIQSLGTITLSASSVELASVEVTARAPVFIREIDRTVINVDARLTLAGGTALEVLERSPGVFVNRQSGTIGMLGKDGVNVMMNGKISYIPTEALLDYLAGLDANNIQKIELITTPPANLDAQGNARYINIVLKDNPNEGLNGNYALSAGYGKGETGSASVSLNYRKNKMNLFGNLSYTRSGQEQFTSLNRRIGRGDNFVETALEYDRYPTVNNANARLGADFQVSPKTTVGILFSGYTNRWDMDAFINLQTLRTNDSNSFTTADVLEGNYWDHFQTNLNVVHQFENGSRLSGDVDYLYFNQENFVNSDFIERDAGQNKIGEDLVASQKDTPFEIKVGKLDYTKPISSSVKLSSGVKYVYSTFENKVLVNRNGAELPGFNSTSNLTESIFATYAQLDYKLSEKTSLKGGLRYEYSDSELNATNGGRVVDRSFGNLFPSLFFNQKINEVNSFNLSYSKRINRPSFTDLAPFLIFLDPNTSFGGNPGLQPAIAHSFQTGYTLKTININLQYTREDSTIAPFQNRFNPVNNTQIIVPDNLQKQQTVNASITFPIQITEWWNMRLFANYTWQEATTIDENSSIYTIQQNNFRINGNQSFNLPNNFSLELSGFYQTRSLNGNVRIDPFGILNLGLQKKLKNKTRLTFNINDIFNSLKFVGTTDLSEAAFLVSRTFDPSQRTFKLTYSMHFGNQKLKGVRKRNSGRDEKRRVN